MRETWHSYVSPYNVFDLFRYWYANGRPSRVEIANVSADLQTLTSYSTYYIQYNWHGDAVTYVALDGSGAGNATSPYDPWGNPPVGSRIIDTTRAFWYNPCTRVHYCGGRCKSRLKTSPGRPVSPTPLFLERSRIIPSLRKRRAAALN